MGVSVDSSAFPTQSPPFRSKILDVVALLLILAAFVVLWKGFWGFSGFVQDDAFISLRYAQNFASGRGLVFNDGERVEGFTNFSWTLLAALIFKLGFQPLSVLRIFSCLCGSALVALVWFHGGARFWRKNSLGGVWGGLAALLLASSTTLALWSVSGLEETLFTLLVFAGFVAFIRENMVATALFWLMATLSRPEGPLVFAIGCFVRILWLRNEGRSSSIQDRVGLAIFSIGFVGFLLWRKAYFGYFVPNTFFVKGIANWASHTHGWTVFKRFLDFNDNGVLLGLGLLTLAGVFLCRRVPGKNGQNLKITTKCSMDGTHFEGPPEESWELPEAAFSGLLLISWSYYMIRIGGDILPFFRLNMPMLPFVAICASRSVGFVAGFTPTGNVANSGNEAALIRWGRYVGAVAIFAFLVFNSWSSLQFSLRHVEFNGALQCLQICHGGAGAFLEAEARKQPPGRVLNVIAQDMGMTPFVASSVRFVDTIGLTDGEVARTLYRFSYTPYLRYILWADNESRSRIWEMEMKLRQYLDAQKADFIVVNIDSPSKNVHLTRKAIASSDQDYFTPLIEQNTFYHGYPATPEFKDHYKLVRGFEFSYEAFLLVYARLP